MTGIKSISFERAGGLRLHVSRTSRYLDAELRTDNYRIISRAYAQVVDRPTSACIVGQTGERTLQLGQASFAVNDHEAELLLETFPGAIQLVTRPNPEGVPA